MTGRTPRAWPRIRRRAPQSFEEAIVTASESESPVEFDADSLNPHYSYYDEQNHVHQVWMLDGVTAYNELRAVGTRGRARHRPVAPGYGRSLVLVDLGYDETATGRAARNWRTCLRATT